ncbi:GNAT family N-acetyltransferase [Egicoccus sp. AB-alg6-2]|uniref:GNAT family N-acetyltransferase n=1 Tax=Egicoccus sp. AB-alg6-2 TaxID=3242692 RepID=UPI00359DE50E
MPRRLRWRRAGPGELETIVSRLEGWPSEAGGGLRHMFALSVIETQGVGQVRLATDDHRWAAAVVFPNRLVVPCGDASAIEDAGSPARRWRLLVGDVAAGDAVLRNTPTDPALVVHDQRFFVVDPERVPGVAELPDPGLRRAEPADLDGLADLAVQLHVDDRFGPDPGRVGWRGYRQRLESTVRQGMAYCVGPIGRPVLKLERSVSSRRWGVQLAGIVAAPEVRGQGLGRAAVATAVRAALAEGPQHRPISLHVRADNPGAHAAYFAAGFVDREAWRLAVRS